MTQQRSQGGPGVAMAGDTGALAQGHGTSNTEKATEQRGEVINWDERRETSTALAMDRTGAGVMVALASPCQVSGDRQHMSLAWLGCMTWDWSYTLVMLVLPGGCLGQQKEHSELWTVPQARGSSGNLIMALSVTAPGGDSRTLLRSPRALSSGKVFSLTGEVMGQPGTCPWASPVSLFHSSRQLFVVLDGMESGPGLLS